MILKKIVLSIIFLFLFNSILLAKNNCQKLFLESNKISEIKDINIIFKNQKKWQKKIASILNPKLIVQSNSIVKKSSPEIETYKVIVKNKKKRQDASIIFNFKSGSSCKYKAKIRPHGDLKDHYKIINGYPVSSMNINLEEGNIENITKFILFLPSTRSEDDEILTTSLLKHLDFLSPRTSYIKVNINEKKFKYIFQEKIVKEFLENNNLVEGPIFKGQENFPKRYKYDSIRPAMLSNPGWDKNINNSNLSIKTLSNVNSFYLGNIFENNCNQLIINNTLLNEKEKNIFGQFDLFLKIIDGIHGLGSMNRRFYYDPINDNYLPIYYDGDIKFSRYGGIKKQYDISKQDASCFNYIEKKSFINLEKKLNRINIEKLKIELNKKGLTKISKKDIKTIIDSLKNRIDIIKISQSNEIIKKNYNPIITPELYTKYYNKKNYLNDSLVFLKNMSEYDNVENQDAEFIKCEINIKNCEKIFLNELEINDLLKQEYKKKINPESEIFFISTSLKDYKKGNYNRKYFGISDYNHKKLKNINIFYNNFIEINIDQKNKLISLAQTNSKGRVLISDSILNTWKIDFINGDDRKLSKNNLKINNLTGCITFLDTTINDLEIKTYNLKCEDSINFIRSKGTIKDSNVNKSLSDGIDADFSEIIFRNITIEDAINDCIDLSYGIYQIISSNISNCGDKGVSVGESSKTVIDQLMLKNTNIGVASKDSSLTMINNSSIESSKVCLSAYNKKQEFNGASLKLNNLKCKDFEIKYDIEPGSILIE